MGVSCHHLEGHIFPIHDVVGYRDSNAEGILISSLGFRIYFLNEGSRDSIMSQGMKRRKLHLNEK